MKGIIGGPTHIESTPARKRKQEKIRQQQNAEWERYATYPVIRYSEGGYAVGSGVVVEMDLPVGSIVYSDVPSGFNAQKQESGEWYVLGTPYVIQWETLCKWVRPRLKQYGIQQAQQ